LFTFEGCPQHPVANIPRAAFFDDVMAKARRINLCPRFQPSLLVELAVGSFEATERAILLQRLIV
jgi:hypothetical protein